MGLSVFALGILLLLLTFGLAVRVFLQVDTSLQGEGPYLTSPAAAAHSRPAADDQGRQTDSMSPLLTMALGIGLKFLGLFVMGYVASLVAGRGVQCACAPVPPLVIGTSER